MATAITTADGCPSQPIEDDALSSSCMNPGQFFVATWQSGTRLFRFVGWKKNGNALCVNYDTSNQRWGNAQTVGGERFKEGFDLTADDWIKNLLSDEDAAAQYGDYSVKHAPNPAPAAQPQPKPPSLKAQKRQVKLDTMQCELRDRIALAVSLGIPYDDEIASAKKSLSAERIANAENEAKEQVNQFPSKRAEADICPPPMCPDCNHPITGTGQGHRSSPEHVMNTFNPKIDLTDDEKKTFGKFVALGKSLDQPMSELLALAIEVKGIFAAKTRGIPVMYAGQSYMNFDKFVGANFPICGRQMRRLLAKEGLTDQRFANKPKPEPLPESILPAQAESTPAPIPETTVAVVRVEPQEEIQTTVAIVEIEPTEPAAEPQPIPSEPESEPTPPWNDRTKEETKKIKSLLGLPSRQPLPPLVAKAFEVGHAEGYDDGYANGQEAVRGLLENETKPPEEPAAPAEMPKLTDEQREKLQQEYDALWEEGDKIPCQDRTDEYWAKLEKLEDQLFGIDEARAAAKGSAPKEYDLPAYTVTLHARSITSMKAHLKKLGIEADVKKIVPVSSRADRLSEAEGQVQDAKQTVEDLRDELQTWFDNLHENFQSGQKGMELEEAISALDDLAGELDNISFDGVTFPGMF